MVRARLDPDDDTVLITVRVPRGERDRFNARCRADGVMAASILRGAITTYLEGERLERTAMLEPDPITVPTYTNYGDREVATATILSARREVSPRFKR